MAIQCQKKKREEKSLTDLESQLLTIIGETVAVGLKDIKEMGGIPEEKVLEETVEPSEIVQDENEWENIEEQEDEQPKISKKKSKCNVNSDRFV